MTVTDTWAASGSLELVTGALERAGCPVKGVGRQRNSRCPVLAHDDHTPSLRIADGMDRVLIFCQGPCTTQEVLDALGLDWDALFHEPRKRAASDDWTPWQRDCPCRPVARYKYVDESGELLYEHVRGAHKEFAFRRPDPSSRSGWRWSLGDVRRVLYRLPEVLAAPASACVFVTEGEKDADALTAAGEIATTTDSGALNGEGAKRWRPEWTEALAGRDALIVADRDPAGRVHADHVAASIDEHVRFWWIVQAAEGKDAADHLAAGHSPAKFVWWS